MSLTRGQVVCHRRPRHGAPRRQEGLRPLSGLSHLDRPYLAGQPYRSWSSHRCNALRSERAPLARKGRVVRSRAVLADTSSSSALRSSSCVRAPARLRRMPVTGSRWGSTRESAVQGPPSNRSRPDASGASCDAPGHRPRSPLGALLCVPGELGGHGGALHLAGADGLLDGPPAIHARASPVQAHGPDGAGLACTLPPPPQDRAGRGCSTSGHRMLATPATLRPLFAYRGSRHRRRSSPAPRDWDTITLREDEYKGA